MAAHRKVALFFFMLNLWTILDWVHPKASFRSFVVVERFLDARLNIKYDKGIEKMSDDDEANLTS